MVLPPPFLWLVVVCNPLNPHVLLMQMQWGLTPLILAQNQPQRASSSLHLVELALSLSNDEFTGRQNPKLNKN